MMNMVSCLAGQTPTQGDHMEKRSFVVIALLVIISAEAGYAAPDPCYDAVKQGKFRDAITLCTKQIESNADVKGVSDAYRYRGIAYLETGKPDLAIADFDIAIKRNESDAAAYSNRGTAYMSKKMFLLAIADFDKVIKLNPRDDIAYKNRGVAYIGKNQLDQAIADFNKALEINPNDDQTYNDRGAAYLETGKIDLAIADYNKSIQLNPTNEEPYRNRGAAYTAAGRFDAARADYSKALELDPADSRGYYNMACLHSLQKNTQEACSWLQKAVDHGYSNWQHIKEDSDLENVREDECYQKIMKGK
jgi:Flp pilus assembly protein TadD